MPLLRFHIIAHPDSGLFTFSAKLDTNAELDTFSHTDYEASVDAGQDDTLGTVVLWEKDLNDSNVAALAYNPNSGQYLNLKCRGLTTTGDGRLESFGMRLIMQDKTGIAMDFFGAGVSADTFRTTYANALFLLTALGYKFGVLHFGAHEIASSGKSPAAFKVDYQEMIDWIRGEMGTTFPIVLMCDQYHDAASTADMEKLARYPQMMLELAQDNLHVLAVNSMRAMDILGFNFRRENEDDYSDKGAYSDVTAYVVDDIVTHAVDQTNVHRWLCILATTGNDPPMHRYWQPMGRYVQTSDGLHITERGGLQMAQIETSLMLGDEGAMGSMKQAGRGGGMVG